MAKPRTPTEINGGDMAKPPTPEVTTLLGSLNASTQAPMPSTPESIQLLQQLEVFRAPVDDASDPRIQALIAAEQAPAVAHFQPGDRGLKS